MSSEHYKKETRLMHAGRKPEEYFGAVNPPILRASTLLYKDMDAYFDMNTKYRYGRVGNPLSAAVEEALAELEGGYNAITAASGLLAITSVMNAFVKAGDHVLIVDSCYPGTRYFAQNQLRKNAVEVEFYDPMIGAGIEALIRENTALIHLESPCSATFEVQDVPAIAKIAKARGIITMIDNTYSAGVFFKPLSYGVDVSVQSAAKYLGGHADVNLGVAVAADAKTYKTIKSYAVDLGVCAGAEDLYMTLRGLRTLEMRLDYAQNNVRPVLEWFKTRPEVQMLYSPVLESNKGHEIWKRDFAGSNGLFTVLFNPEYSRADVARFVDSLTLFPVGSSWGGYESLIQPQDMEAHRTNFGKEGVMIRFQVGNENTDDLIADLEQGIANLASASSDKKALG